MDFATTSELDNLLVSNPLIYSTGRTTGPKGYSTSCRMSITNINQYIVINIGGIYYPFSNAIAFRYNDTSYISPVQLGDSGSAVIGEFSGGVRKILGIVFAKSTTISYFCRIDEIVNQLDVRKWDWTDAINPTVLNTRLIEGTPALLKIETAAGTYNTVKSQNKIVVGGKTYYQAGFTKNSYTLYTG
jgi:YHS domain-containing protein